MSEDFYAGKRYWIIGASAGIGRSLAAELGRRGASLVLSARSEASLRELAGEIATGPLVLPLDIGRFEAVADAVETLAEGTRFDGVICSAALYDPGRVADLDPRQAEALLRVNVLGALFVSRLAPQILRKGGQLALFGSVAGYFGLPRGQAYSASKAAIINLAETLRVEYAPDVDVRLISPGFVRTRLTDKNDFEMPSLMEPEDAARVIADGLARPGFELHFPKSLTWKLKVLRSLPYGLALRLSARAAG
jgi:NAD(P)-dependent dehydrogenase (short-subunit alcohol dehydrogenase family)